jgi:uncharacterized BrkB/YihY/UPF0761 family membrane protein
MPFIHVCCTKNYFFIGVFVYIFNGIGSSWTRYLGIVSARLFSYPEYVHNIFFNFLRYSSIILLFFFSISLIYYYGPATKKKYRFISTGATVATFLSILASIGFSYYVKHFVKLNTFLALLER